jgi:hypothetical protein
MAGVAAGAMRGAGGGDGLPCRRGEVRRPREARVRASCWTAREGLSHGPARPAAIHVPGLRVAARRPAHARTAPSCRLGLLCLRADLHLALLWRAAHGRLCAVQLRDAGHRQAVRGHPRRRPRAGRSGQVRRGRRHQSLRADRLGRAAAAAAEEINGVRIIGIDVPGFGVPTHAEAKDVLAGAMLPMPAPRPSRARCRRPRQGADERPTVTLLGEMFPADPVVIGACWSPWAWPPARWCRRANGASSTPRSIAPRSPRSIPSTRLHPRVRGGRPRDRRLGAGRLDGTAAWLEAIGAPATCPGRQDRCRQERLPAGHPRRAAGAHQGPHHAVGYEGSELLVARLLIESGADVRYVGTACPKTPGRSRPRVAGSQGRPGAVPRLAGAGHRRRRASSSPISPSAPRRWCRRPRRVGTPALYFTNLISARPLMGPAGAGSLAQVVNAAMANKPRFDACAFFEGVGEGDTPASGKTPRSTAHLPQENSPQAGPRIEKARRIEAPTDAESRSRSRRRLLGLRLCLHGDQGPAGHHRRPGGLREPAGHLGAALHRRAAAARAAIVVTGLGEEELGQTAPKAR